MAKIPPRPWRYEVRADLGDEPFCDGVFDAKNYDVIKTDSGVYPPNVETADLICRMVNAEREIAAFLKKAADCEKNHTQLACDACTCGMDGAAELLAKVVRQ